MVNVMLVPDCLEIIFKVLRILISLYAPPVLEGFTSSDVCFIFGDHHNTSFSLFGVLFEQTLEIIIIFGSMELSITHSFRFADQLLGGLNLSKSFFEL